MLNNKLPVLLFCASLSAFAQAVLYPSGPFGCAWATGYLDQPFCTIPNELPLGSFVQPLTGGSYTDPNFGGHVALATGAGFTHPYSSPSPLSAHNRYLAIQDESNGFSHVSDPYTGRIIYPGVMYSSAGRFWDAYDDEVFYVVLGSKILKYTLNTGVTTTVIDYAASGYGFTSILTGGSTDTTRDNWMAFWAPGQHKVCALDLTNVRTYCADYTAPNPNSRVGWDYLDYALLSKGVDSTNGKRYVLLMATPAMGAWSVNMQTGVLDFEFRGPENPEMRGNGDGICDPGENCLSAPHSDTMADADGKQYLVEAKGSNDPCQLNMVTLDLSKGVDLWKLVSQGGGRKAGMDISNCGDPWPDHHIGCAKSVPYCVMSTMTGAIRNPADLTTPLPSVPHRDELIVMHGNALDFTRLAMTRSVQYSTDSYWTEPRAALSNDGSFVVFDSNFGNPTALTTRVAIASTGLTSTVSAPSVSVSLNAGGTIFAGQSIQFIATVNGTTNTAVNWWCAPQVGTMSANGLYTAPAVITSTQTLAVKVTSVADPTKSATSYVVLQPSGTASNVNIRVNAGGPAVTDGAGKVWAADSNYSGGGSVDTGSWVAGTTTPAIYGSARYGDTTYNFPVPNGAYNVTLKFAEISGLAAGQRLFNVALNGTVVLPNFDVSGAAGGPGIAVDRTFPVNVVGGNISIQTSIVKYGAVLSGIQILPATLVAFPGSVSTPAGSGFVPITPCRVVDTRNAAGVFGGPYVVGRRDFPLPASTCNIPSNAVAYSLNITVVPRGPLAYLTMWPTGSTQPGVSTLNSWDGRMKANAAIVGAGTGGSVSVFVTNPTDVVLDINGYFVATTVTTAMQFYPVTPCRVADTRSGGSILTGGQTRSFAVVSSACGIPSSATAYALNMTALPPGPLDWLSTWPAGSPWPGVSTLNAPTGAVSANAAIVPAGANGSINVLPSNATHLVIDVNGYFAPPGAVGALSFYPTAPCRVADTRNTVGPFGGPSMAGSSVRTFAVAQSGCNIPSTAAAFSFNTTVLPTGYLGYVTLFPASNQQPIASTLNSWDGAVASNAALVPAGSQGSFSVFTSDATAFIVDVNGYFAP